MDDNPIADILETAAHLCGLNDNDPEIRNFKKKPQKVPKIAARFDAVQSSSNDQRKSREGAAGHDKWLRSGSHFYYYRLISP